MAARAPTPLETRRTREELLSSRFDPRKLVLVLVLASACAGLVHVFFFTH